jgi:methyl-accepting chemotaxis protein
MSIQKKTLLAFFATMATIALALFVFTQVFLLDNFAKLDNQAMEDNVKRLDSTIQQGLDSMLDTTVDYAMWDDAYQFIQDENQEFRQSNLDDFKLNDFGVNFIAFTDLNGNIRYSRHMDFSTGQLLPEPAELKEAIQSQVLPQLSDANPSYEGILNIGGQDALFASALILKSNGSGPAKGMIITGRFIDSLLLDEWHKSTGLEMDFVDEPSTLARLSFQSPTLIENGKNSTVIGYHLLTDTSQQPVRVIQITESRVIYQEGLKSVLLFVGLVAAVGWIGAFVVVYIYNRIIFKPLKRLRNLAAEIGSGDFSVRVDNPGSDEIGDVYRTFNGLTEYLNEVANVSSEIANGKLTASIQPRSEKDILGKSTGLMITNLRSTLQTLTESVGHLNQTSGLLVQTADDAGQATDQIANTIQQVARGAAQQSDSVNRTAQSIEQMVRAIDGVARGANDQAEAATEAATVTGQLSSIINQVRQSADSMVAQSQKAAETTQTSADVVHETLNGMQRIRESVSTSNSRVEEMGQRSEKIGEFVSAIEEIASQTNLLALNAAIEAARAETQAAELIEYLLNRQMVSQARLVDAILTSKGEDQDHAFWQTLAQYCNLDTVLVTDADGVINSCNDPALLGFRFSEDPKEQSYAFRKLLHEKNGVVTQPPQKRSADTKIYKFVGISRSDRPGIIQVAFDANSISSFQLQVGGFSVVANEVYRLAENAKASASNIAQLVKQINKSVVEATNAMKTSTQEVDASVESANKAETALGQIQDAFQEVLSQAQIASQASQKMTESTSSLVQAVESVSAIVEENTAATEEMSAGANEVSTSIESIASISEENSAAVEEVSASAEEMNNQVQAVNNSAKQLAELAEKLQKLVDNFTL